jgi:transposase-like protein
MDLYMIMERFPDHESCINYLEDTRWGKHPKCPYCESEHVARKHEGDKIGRWNCHGCKSSFIQGTLFQGTRIPLHKWFMAITLIANAKKSLSSCQLARHLGVTQQTTWYMMQRIRSEMASQDKDSPLLKGIIEADEAYLGGKPRKPNKRDDDEPNPRGRGTTAILGAVQRGGQVVARVATDLTSRGILNFVKGNVTPEGSTLITDENQAYNAVGFSMDHKVIKHKKQFVDGDTHTNTIEGFWSLLKRAWYGQHHHYRKQYTPLYVAEACWKYNHRKTKNIFDVFLKGCFQCVYPTFHLCCRLF